MPFRILLFALGLALLSPAEAQETPGSRAFEKLRSLEGHWEGTFEWSGTNTAKGKMDAEYYLTGNGSAVVENLVTEGKPMMTTVYHLDGPALRLTHFCAAQNQPRLKADRIDVTHNAIDFGFVDVTGLRTPNSGHVHGLEWRMIDPDHITLTFLFEAGDKHSRELIQLKRSVQNASRTE